MGKYDPLKAYLESVEGDEAPMSFDAISEVIGAPLPESQRFAAWWSNNPSNNVMTRVWLEAGFRTERVDLERRRLVFRRAQPPPEPPDIADQLAESQAVLAALDRVAAAPASSRPRVLVALREALADTVRIASGVDLAAPRQGRSG